MRNVANDQQILRTVVQEMYDALHSIAGKYQLLDLCADILKRFSDSVDNHGQLLGGSPSELEQSQFNSNRRIELPIPTFRINGNFPIHNSPAPMTESEALRK